MSESPLAQPGAGPILTLIGERVALGPVHRGIVPLLWTWENDLELSVLTGDPVHPLSPEAAEQLYESRAKANPAHASFVIYERETLRPIGTIGLPHINHAHRTAELGVGIGAAEDRGKGYGTEAVRLLLDYAFNVLGLHNVMLRVFSYNERAIRSYLKVGFREMGRRRGAQRVGGIAYDVVYMDCIAPEFEGSTLRRYLPSAPTDLTT